MKAIITTTTKTTSLAISTNNNHKKNGHNDDINIKKDFDTTTFNHHHDDLSQSSFLSSRSTRSDDISSQQQLSSKEVSNNNNNSNSTPSNSILIQKNTANYCDGYSISREFDDSIRTYKTTTTTAPSTYLHETTPFDTTKIKSTDCCTIISNGSGSGSNISRKRRERSGQQQQQRAALFETLKPNERKHNDLSEFTINKLKFSSLGIYGRDEEISIIQNAFEESFSSSPTTTTSTTTNTNNPNKDPASSQRQQKIIIAGKRRRRRHLICISGASGTGKSKLVDAALEIPTKKMNGLLVRGKFDLNLSTRNEPYSAFSRAYSEICAEILEIARKDPEASLRIRNDIKESLHSEFLALLAQIVPALPEIIDLDEDNNTNDDTNDVSNQNTVLEGSPTSNLSASSSLSSLSSEESKNRFQYAFLKFTRVISSHFMSFVIVLDDLQWADASSLELLRILISDYENPHLLIIGTYRSDDDEVANNNPSSQSILVKTLNELESKWKEEEMSCGGDGSGSISFQLTQIHLENLGIDSVYNIIQDLLSTTSNNNNNSSSSSGDEDKTMKLAEICHKKTNGNVFYLLSFLALLSEHDLLKFNFGTLSWTWDETEIESNTSAATNVVDLLLSRINVLPPNLIELVKLASCLGYEFEVPMLQLVWQRKWVDIFVSVEEKEEEEEGDKEGKTLLNGLERLEQEGFIERCKNKVVSTYRWVHDKIQEACLSLIPESNRKSYNRKIGEIFLEGLKGDDFDNNILILVDLLNDGLDDDSFQSSEESLRLARLNLQACRKALSMSSFESAAVYAGYGIRLLPSNSWNEHYHLSLELYSLGAKAEGAIGNVETMNKFCHVVLSQEDIPTSDKFGVYNTWVDSIIARGFFQEAIDVMLSILGEFQCTFPKNSIMVGLSLVRQIIKLQLKTKSKDLSKLKEMDDPTRSELVAFVIKLSHCFYLNGDVRLPLAFFRSMNWSIKYGCCEHSPVAIATAGMLLTGIFDDLKGGSRFGEQALELIKKRGISPAKAKTILVVHAYLLVWTKPAGEMIKPLLKAYEMCLQTGDTDSAMWAVCHSTSIRFILGSSLESLEADFLMYSRQAEALRKDQCMFFCKISRQACLNLMGQNNIEDPTQIIGNSLNENEFEYCKQNKFLLPWIRFWISILSSYFGKHAELVNSYEVDFSSKVMVALPLNMSYYLLAGVSCFAHARETGKKKYAKMGQSILFKFRKWVKGGNPNVRHLEAFLEAELMVVNKKHTLARKRYENSILLSARSGFQHDAAFASERYGRFCLDVEKDIDEAKYRIREAIKYWESWGALSKVRSLEVEFPGLVEEKPSQILL